MAADTGAAEGKANLGTLNDILFAEMRQLMALPMSDWELAEREVRIEHMARLTARGLRGRRLWSPFPRRRSTR